jgi:archaellum biogenesis ATPase FlaH
MKTTYLEKLKKYRGYGFSVMPIKRKSKKAFIKWKEFQAKRPTKRQLKAWAEDYPDANIAIITGKVSGVVVVDADSDKGMKLIKKIGLPKNTPTVSTNRGEHYYFRYPDCDVPSKKFKKLGLDIQSDGSYVMAPPSEHPDGGTYKWKVDLMAELPELPKKLLRQLEKTIKQKADSDPFIKEPGVDVVDISDSQASDLPQEVQKWLETPMGEDRSGHDFKLCMLCLEHGIFNRKSLAEIIHANEHGKAATRKDRKKYVSELIKKAEEKFDTQIRCHSARKLARMEFPTAHGIIGKGVLLPGTGAIIAGEGGVGKSLLTSEMALRLRIGQAFIGIPTAKIDSVLVIQGEIRLEMVKERLTSQVKGLGLKKSPRRMYFTDPRDSYDLMNAKDLAKILRLVMRTKAEVVVIDPLSSYHHKNENDNSEMRSFLSKIDKIKSKTGAAVVLVHHFSKSADKKGKHRLRGASSIYDWADTVIELSAGSPANMLKAKILKLRNGAPLSDIYLKRDDNFIHQVVEDKSKCPPDKVREVLENEFNGECKQQKELVDKLCKVTDSSDKTARAGVKLAVKRGVIQEVSTDGKSKGYRISKK